MAKDNRHTIIKETDDEEQKDNKKKIILIIALIIIILALISSCSCTSNFFGVIGNIFRNEHDVDITEDPQEEVIKNKNLKFLEDKLEIDLGDNKSKLGFYYKNISPNEFTCQTSDASIASCYVENDYIVVNPYKEGTVTIYLRTKTNNKTYEATAKLTITDNSEKGIKLSETSGSINLAYESSKNVAYTLTGIKGNVTATSSDDSIAKGTIENGVLKITAYKVGEAKITLNITYNGTTYTSVYTVKVTNQINGSSTGTGTGRPNQGNQGNQGGSSTTPSTPTYNADKDSSLVNITSNKVDVGFSADNTSYEFGVAWYTTKINFDVTAKAGTVSYQYKRADSDKYEKVDSLKGLKLKSGDNIIIITVTSKDGSSTTVYRINVNKASGTYLKNIESSDIDLPKFNKNTTSYSVTTDKDIVSLDVTKGNSSQDVTYTFRGTPISEDDLSKLELINGSNMLEIKVTHDEEDRVYKVNIIKENKQDPTDKNSLLSALSDDLGNIKFNPNNYTYSYNVNNSTKSFILTADAEDSDAEVTIKYNGQEYKGTDIVSAEIKDLQEGKNTITVISKNGKNTTTYTINVTRLAKAEEEKDSTLSSLTADKGNIEFSPDELKYEINVGWLTTKISLEAIAPNGTITYEYKRADKDEYEIVDSLENLKLKSGTNTILISVESKDKSNITVYRVDVNKETGNYIKEIKSDDIDIDFDKKTQTYKVETTKDKISLDVTKDDKSQDVSYTFRGTPISESELSNLTLLPGTNVIEVIAKHNDEERKYTIKVIKKDGEVDTNSSLSSLTDSLGKIDFDNPNVTEYYMPVANSVTSFNLSAVAESANAVVTISYNGQEYKDVKSVNALINDLQEGKNTITVLVSNGKNETPYTITVDRSRKPGTEEGNDKITNITLGDGMTFDKPFNSDDLYYTVNVGNSKKLSFTIIIDSNSVAHYCYQDKCVNNEWTEGTSIDIEDLEYGENQVLIRVTEKGNADDEGTLYHITVIREGTNTNGIAELGSITINGTSIDLVDAANDKAEIEISSIDDISVYAIPKYNGTVSYEGIEDINNLQPGETGTLKITVTSNDNKNKKTYSINVKKREEEPTTSNLAAVNLIKIDGQVIDLNDAANGKAEITIDEKQDYEFVAEAAYEGTLTYDPENVEEHLANLVPGASTTIKVTATSEDGSNSKTYSIKVTKNKKVNEEDSIAKAKEIVINGTSIDLDKALAGTEEIEISSKDEVTLTALADYEGTITFDGYDTIGEVKTALNDLAVGDSITLTAVVYSKDTTNKETYTFKVTKKDDGGEEPEPSDGYTIEFVGETPTCTIGSECELTYVIKDEDGNQVTQSYEGKINIPLTLDGIDLDSSVRGIIKFTPKFAISTSTTTKTLTISLGDKTSTQTSITFERPDYSLDLQSDDGKIYVRANSNNTIGSASLIIDTNMFETREIDDVVSSTAAIELFGTDKDLESITVTSSNNIVEFSFDKENNESTNSLPVSIEVNRAKLDSYLANSGEVTPEFDITVTGYLYGKEIKKTVKLQVIREYVVTFDSGEGVYSDELDSEGNPDTIRTEPRDRGESIDLSTIDVPYVSSNTSGDNMCVIITKVFKQYVDESGNPVTEISDIRRDMTLTAEYEDKSESPEVKPEFPEKIIWLTLDGNDENGLFYTKQPNKNSNEFFPTDSKYQEKLIYPGISGSYTMNITNTLESKNPIMITGLILEEQTICVKDGCVNMGFMVKSGNHSGGQEAAKLFGDGDKATDREQYIVLNSVKASDETGATIDKLQQDDRNLTKHTGTNRVEMLFDESTNANTTLDADEYFEITLHWKWLDDNDSVDTAIGKIVNDMDPDDNLYGIKIGIRYVEVCK